MRNRALTGLLFGAALALPAGAVAEPAGFLSADSPREWSFPRDHGAHPGYQTEWWYLTGNLDAENGRRFGYQFTIFRRQLSPEPVARASRWASNDVLLVHAALADPDADAFHAVDFARRPVLGMARVSTQTLDAHVEGFRVWLDGDLIRVTGKADDFAYYLVMRPVRPPVFHGPGGVERKGEAPGQASYYYSITRLETSGTVTTDGTTHVVSGQSWFDHEFGSSTLAAHQAGWDWFSVQLSDGSEIMLYQMRNTSGGIDPGSSGTHIAPDGEVGWLAMEEFTVETVDTWKSPTSGAVYPSGWRLSVPSHDLDMEVTPVMRSQEVSTEASTNVTYWEGAVDVKGTRNGKTVDGRGYVELTGYADSLGGRI